MDKLINCEDEDHDYLFKIVVIGLIFLKKKHIPPPPPPPPSEKIKGETGVGKT